MKRRKLVEVERKPKYEEIEIELWECPKCEGTLFRREYVFELQKVERALGSIQKKWGMGCSFGFIIRA